MKTYIKLAWRNVWRNKRRSLITISSIFFATFLAIVMNSFQKGTYNNMIYSMVEMYTGYIQVEHKDHIDEPNLENTMALTAGEIEQIGSVKNVSTVAPRLNAFALASSGTQTKGVMFTGIDPEIENEMTGLKEKLVKVYLSKETVQKLLDENIPDKVKEKLEINMGRFYSSDEVLKFDLGLEEDDNAFFEQIKMAGKVSGHYLKPGSSEVLIGGRLAKYLNLGVGDTLVLIGQGYHGTSAAGQYTICGIMNSPNPLLDSRLVYADIRTVQFFSSAFQVNENNDTVSLYSTFAVNVIDKDYDVILSTATAIEQVVGHDNHLAVRGWKDANKQLEEQIRSDYESGQLMVAILYLVIAFGIFGTILMMTAERKREMGVMVAIGMKKIKLGLIICIEMIFISMAGVLLAMLVTAPIILYGYYNPWRLTGEMATMMEGYGIEPVMPLAWFDTYFYGQAFIVLIILLIVMIYPMVALKRMKVIKALKN